MPAFAYRGRDARGGLVTGRLEGASSGAVADQLLAIGVTPVEISPAGESAVAAQKEELRRELLVKSYRKGGEENISSAVIEEANADVGAEMRYYLGELGVDALFTDNPDRFPRDAGSK